MTRAARPRTDDGQGVGRSGGEVGSRKTEGDNHADPAAPAETVPTLGGQVGVWLNVMADWPLDRVAAVLRSKDTPVAKIMAATRLLGAVQMGPRAGEDFDRCCRQSLTEDDQPASGEPPATLKYHAPVAFNGGHQAPGG